MRWPVLFASSEQAAILRLLVHMRGRKGSDMMTMTEIRDHLKLTPAQTVILMSKLMERGFLEPTR